jgi:drug/metabolite transporter (DMT)-like permease
MPVGEFAALATAVLWCFTSLLFGEAARRIGSLAVNLLRLPIALVLLSLVLATTSDAFAGLDGTRVTFLVVSGIVGLSIGDLAYFGALRRLGARLSLLLLSLAPIFATVTAVVVLDEVPSPLAFAGIGVTLAGVAWVVLERRHDDTPHVAMRPGIIMGVVAAVCQGVGLVLAKVGMGGVVSPLTASWVRIAFGGLALWLATAVFGRLREARLSLGVARAGWLLLGGALCGPFLGVWLSLVAARLTAVGVAATIMATNPVIIIPIVMYTERYRPSWRAIGGTVVTVIGVALLFAR